MFKCIYSLSFMMYKKRYRILIFQSILSSMSNAKRNLLHVRAISGLRRHRLALDALSAGVVVLRVLANIGGTRV
jgi:hypothetical protein